MTVYNNKNNNNNNNGFVWKQAPSRVLRHDALNDCISHALNAAGIPVRKEPAGLALKDGKRLVAPSFLGVAANFWLGVSRFAPQWPIHMWQLAVSWRDTGCRADRKCQKKTPNCLQLTTLSQWRSKRTGQWMTALLVIWAGRFLNVRATSLRLSSYSSGSVCSFNVLTEFFSWDFFGSRRQWCWSIAITTQQFLGRILNRVACVRPSIHNPSTKCFFDFNEIWLVGRGQSMSDAR